MCWGECSGADLRYRCGLHILQLQLSQALQRIRRDLVLLPYHPVTNPSSRLLPTTVSPVRRITRHVVICSVGGLSPAVLQRLVTVLRSRHIGVQPTVVVMQPVEGNDKRILRYAAILNDVWVVQVRPVLRSLYCGYRGLWQ